MEWVCEELRMGYKNKPLKEKRVGGRSRDESILSMREIEIKSTQFVFVASCLYHKHIAVHIMLFSNHRRFVSKIPL